MVLTHLVRRGGAGRGSRAGRIGEAARRDGARLRAGPQHGSGAGRGGAGRGAQVLARRRSAKRQGEAGPARWKRGRRWRRPSARASIGPTARILPPRRSCSSPPCATVSPEGPAPQQNSQHETIEPARPRRRGGRGGVPPPKAPPPQRAPVGPPRAFVAQSAHREHPLDRACPSAPLYGSAPALPSASIGPFLSPAARLSARTSHVNMSCPKRQARSVDS